MKSIARRMRRTRHVWRPTANKGANRAAIATAELWGQFQLSEKSLRSCSGITATLTNPEVSRQRPRFAACSKAYGRFRMEEIPGNAEEWRPTLYKKARVSRPLCPREAGSKDGQSIEFYRNVRFYTQNYWTRMEKRGVTTCTHSQER